MESTCTLPAEDYLRYLELFKDVFIPGAEAITPVTPAMVRRSSTDDTGTIKGALRFGLCLLR